RVERESRRDAEIVVVAGAAGEDERDRGERVTIGRRAVERVEDERRGPVVLRRAVEEERRREVEGALLAAAAEVEGDEAEALLARALVPVGVGEDRRRLLRVAPAPEERRGDRAVSAGGVALPEDERRDRARGARVRAALEVALAERPEEGEDDVGVGELV